MQADDEDIWILGKQNCFRRLIFLGEEGGGHSLNCLAFIIVIIVFEMPKPEPQKPKTKVKNSYKSFAEDLGRELTESEKLEMQRRSDLSMAMELFGQYASVVALTFFICFVY